jgi:integrase
MALPPCGRRERVLTRCELSGLYKVSSRAFRRLLFVQLHTLARPGEIRQLTWGQIDWEQRVIVLSKFKGQKRRRDKLKARLIAMPKPVQRLLWNLCRKAQERPDYSGDARVFLDTRGKPWTPNGGRCAMRRARERAGLNDGGERVVCYTLRHTAATKAVRQNLNLKLVAEMMGHSQTRTTERYLHLDTADLVDGIDQMNARPRTGRAI